jgi:hypothetical protein
MDWFDFGLSVVLTTLRGAVKNAEKKKQLRAAALKVAATINAIWFDDEEFGIVLKAKTVSEKTKLGL